MKIPSTDTIIRAVCGEFIKLFHKAGLVRPPKYGTTKKRETGRKVIVSLTSYGRRVGPLLALTVISLMRQKYKPDAIIIWLDQEKWNDECLPKCLRKLLPHGLTIKYRKDIGPYTKIIHALKEFPDDLIITVDDDIYYSSSLVSDLVMAHRDNPNMINSLVCHRLTFNPDGTLRPYNDWQLNTPRKEGGMLFATGAGGVIYDPVLMHKDTTNEELFRRLSPKADDVWLFFMEILSGTKVHKVIPDGKSMPLDAFYQRFHSRASLHASNVGQSLNDTQIKAILDHYGLEITGKDPEKPEVISCRNKK